MSEQHDDVDTYPGVRSRAQAEAVAELMTRSPAELRRERLAVTKAIDESATWPEALRAAIDRFIYDAKIKLNDIDAALEWHKRWETDDRAERIAETIAKLNQRLDELRSRPATDADAQFVMMATNELRGHVPVPSFERVKLNIEHLKASPMPRHLRAIKWDCFRVSQPAQPVAAAAA